MEFQDEKEVSADKSICYIRRTFVSADDMRDICKGNVYKWNFYLIVQHEKKPKKKVNQLPKRSQNVKD